jgi:ankyrin repeat protein
MSTSIRDALLEGDLSIVESKLDAGADIEELDEDGDTPLLVCCTSNPTIELINHLIDHGANINAVNARGESPLLIAAKYKIGYLSEILLTHEPNVNLTSHDGTTPLYWAAYKKQVVLAKALLRRGADPTINPKNQENGTTLQWAVSTGDLELVRTMVRVGADIDAPGVLHAAIAQIPVLEYLIAQGADIDKKGNWGSTALHIAAYKCKHEAVKVLVANGADISAIDDQDRQTPYEWAQEGGCVHKAILDLLNRA